MFLFSGTAYAVEGPLTGAHLARIEQVKQILGQVEDRPARQIMDEFNRTSAPQGNLQILEAVSATYQDLVDRKKVTDMEEKKQLYNLIRLNVAYLQFGGNIGYQGDKKINLWIRQTLARHLPQELMQNQQVFYTLD